MREAHTLSTFTVKDVLDNYLLALLWSEVHEYGTPLDATHDVSEISEACRNTAEGDCESFLKTAAADLALLPESYGGAEQVGHDFLLTRNGHGAGFWDRNLGELGERLTAHAGSYGVIHAFVDDNGTISTERG